MNFFGGIEGGGTKVKCIIATDPDNILVEKTFKTDAPGILLPEISKFFLEEQLKLGISIHGLGLGFFGPLDLNPKSTKFGWITTTPKKDWENTPLQEYFLETLKIPVLLDTDVNAAANAERIWGSARGVDNFVYITVGTGIGGGIFVNGRPVHGMVHPEIGHFLLRQDLDIDPFLGVCPYHEGCLEGLASGPSLAARWKVDPKLLPVDHFAWDLEARYLGQAVHTLVVTLSPEKIIMGGGVMDQPGLIEKVRIEMRKSIHGYVQSRNLEDMDSYIVKPGLGEKAGILGAVSLFY